MKESPAKISDLQNIIDEFKNNSQPNANPEKPEEFGGSEKKGSREKLYGTKEAVKLYAIDTEQYNHNVIKLRQTLELLKQKNITSPYILKWLAVGTTESKGQPTSVEYSTYANQGDLERFMEMKHEIDEETFKQLLGQMLRAVDDLHKNNVVHRDIKPQNYFISGENPYYAILGDLTNVLAVNETGHPIIPESETKSNESSQSERSSSLGDSGSEVEVIDTPGYAAPELFQYDEKKKLNRQISNQIYITLNLKSVDIYALGKTFEELLNKVKPHLKGQTVKSAEKLIHDMTKEDPEARPRISKIKRSRLFGDTKEMRKRFFNNLDKAQFESENNKIDDDIYFFKTPEFGDPLYTLPKEMIMILSKSEQIDSFSKKLEDKLDKKDFKGWYLDYQNFNVHSTNVLEMIQNQKTSQLVANQRKLLKELKDEIVSLKNKYKAATVSDMLLEKAHSSKITNQFGPEIIDEFAIKALNEAFNQLPTKKQGRFFKSRSKEGLSKKFSKLLKSAKDLDSKLEKLQECFHNLLGYEQRAAFKKSFDEQIHAYLSDKKLSPKARIR